MNIYQILYGIILDTILTYNAESQKMCAPTFDISRACRASMFRTLLWSYNFCDTRLDWLETTFG